MATRTEARPCDSAYTGEYLSRVALPLGGIGAGTICLEGTGFLSHASLRGHLEAYNETPVFSALCIKGDPNLVIALEGPVPSWKVFGPPRTANGAYNKTYGLPGCAESVFDTSFPFLRR